MTRPELWTVLGSANKQLKTLKYGWDDEEFSPLSGCADTGPTIAMRNLEWA